MFLRHAVRWELDEIMVAHLSVTEKTLSVFYWGAKRQFLWDGNKRTGMTLANKVLFAAEAGIQIITDKHMERFKERILDYYDTGDSEKLKAFLYETAIQGLKI